jgi:hypothetical protein
VTAIVNRFTEGKSNEPPVEIQNPVILELAYAEAIPLDLLRSEQQRLPGLIVACMRRPTCRYAARTTGPNPAHGC